MHAAHATMIFLIPSFISNSRERIEILKMPNLDGNRIVIALDLLVFDEEVALAASTSMRRVKMSKDEEGEEGMQFMQLRTKSKRPTFCENCSSFSKK